MEEVLMCDLDELDTRTVVRYDAHEGLLSRQAFEDEGRGGDRTGGGVGFVL